MSSQDAAFAVAQALEKVAKAIDAHRESVDQLIMSLNFQKANTIPKQTQPQEAEPLKPRDTTPTPRSVNWRPFKTGTPGGWIYTNENEPLRDTLLAAKNTGQETVVLEGHTYRLSGDEDQFIQRFPARRKT